MATRVLLHLGDATNKCIFSNVQFHRTKFQVQNILKQTRYFRRIRSREETPRSQQFPSIEIHNGISSSSSKLWKSIIFATTFSGATFVAATILEYERIRASTYKGISIMRPFKSTVAGWRSEARIWWNNLQEGERLFYFILFANVLVYLAWTVPQFQPVMYKYFASNPASSITCLPMLLSGFSHFNLWHLAANMYVLHSFMTTAVSYLGREHFMALYLSSGVLSSMVSNIYKIALHRPGFSLGASGAIMGVLGYVCTQFPDTKLGIVFLPQVTFSAGVAIKSLLAFDILGCILGWKVFDHAAHLGGIFFGMFWQSWGIENIWRKRMPLLAVWHEFRNPPK